MKISVIGASRGRPELFIKGIDSLINQAHNMDDIEIIFRFDDDDEISRKKIEDYYKDKDVNIKLLSGERYGFYFLNKCYEECIKESTGEYIFFWTDDYEFVKENEYCWDAQVQQLEGQIYIADFPESAVKNKVELFGRWPFAVVVPRKLLDLSYRKGCPNVMVDRWLVTYLAVNDIWVRFDSKIAHKNCWSGTTKSDQTYIEGRHAWDGGTLDGGGKGGISRPGISAGKLEGWYHFRREDFMNLKKYLIEHPNTKQFETFKFYLQQDENYEFPLEEWTP